MSIIFLVIVYCVTISAYNFDEVSRKCIAENNKPLPNKFLLGTWYQIYQFGSSLPESEYCPTIEFLKPTANNLKSYRQKYNVTGMPFNFEGNPLVLKEDRMKGLIMGDKEVKYYILDPDEAMVIREVFKVFVYKRLSKKYIVFYPCEMRGHVMWLMSRQRNPPLNETDSLINTTPIFKNKTVRRYCVNVRKPYPLVQNGRYCSCFCCSL